jgi:serine phosphatase RsbU (regulator of sigma subunit)
VAPDRRSAELVLAGHPPPLLLDGSTRELDARAGPPLGVFDELTWPASSHELPAGAQLLLYTDGLTEAHVARGTGERVGIERVIAEIDRLRAAGASPEQLLAGLVALAEQGAADSVADDIALLLVDLDA